MQAQGLCVRCCFNQRFWRHHFWVILDPTKKWLDGRRLCFKKNRIYVVCRIRTNFTKYIFNYWKKGRLFFRSDFRSAQISVQKKVPFFSDLNNKCRRKAFCFYIFRFRNIRTYETNKCLFLFHFVYFLNLNLNFFKIIFWRHIFSNFLFRWSQLIFEAKLLVSLRQSFS